VQQPRKCRNCEEMRDASEFPVDPLHTSKRTRDCQYCIQEGGGHPGMAAPLDGGAAMGVGIGGHNMSMGAWGAHLGDYWIDPTTARCPFPPFPSCCFNAPPPLSPFTSCRRLRKFLGAVLEPDYLLIESLDGLKSSALSERNKQGADGFL